MTKEEFIKLLKEDVEEANKLISENKYPEACGWLLGCCKFFLKKIESGEKNEE